MKSRAEVEAEIGATRTVYALRYPETEDVYREMLLDDHDILADRHRDAWNRKQDAYHESFFDSWVEWVQMTGLELPLDQLPYRYPTAGSSEAIRESLAQLASIERYRPARGIPTIHIFEGDYEGYEALAKPYGIKVVTHTNANRLSEYVKSHDCRGHILYLSQPSSRHGNVLKDFDKTLCFLADKTPLRVALDLCYVGTVPSSRWFNPKHNAPYFFKEVTPEALERIDYIFFSLSKTFGVYYNRIGGVFSRHEMPGLWGNKWFKNLDSLYFGEKLLKAHHPFEIPDKYEDLALKVFQQTQKRYLSALENTFNIDEYVQRMSKSDVLLLSEGVVVTRGRSPYAPVYTRREASGTQGGSIRLCLTPSLHEAILKDSNT